MLFVSWDEPAIPSHFLRDTKNANVMIKHQRESVG